MASVSKIFFYILAVAAAVSQAAVTRDPLSYGPACRVYPGTASWPSANAWSGLNDTVHGQLLQPNELPGGVCHKGQPNYDESQCAARAKAWSTPEFHIADPVSVMFNQFANYTCLPDSNAPCSAAGYPAYVIMATSAADVKAGIDFARNNNIRLVVKSTGHDFLGRSNAPGTLSIWMHRISNIVYHPDHFRLASGRTLQGNAASFGPGAVTWDLYRALDKYGQIAVGGNCKTVSPGGYITGGGHSILSPSRGLAVDNVIEIEVVTADGKIQKVNQDMNTDLFWAIRGGGGATFGVVTSYTIKTFPTPKMTVAHFSAFTTPDSPFLSDLVGYVGAQTPALMNGGLAGFNFLRPNFSNPARGPGQPDYVAGFQGFMATVDDPNGSDTIAKLFKPISDTINQRWPGKASFFSHNTEYKSFLDYFEANMDPTPVGDNKYLMSRLLKQESFNDPKALGDALLSGTGPLGIVALLMVGGKGVQQAKPIGGSNGVNSHWRSAYVHALSAVEGVPFDKAATQKSLKELEDAWAPIRKISPNSGAYINEAYIFEPDFQESFWGTNYPRLAQIKRRVDPQDVFWCALCVGNEHWRQLDSGQLCRV